MNSYHAAISRRPQPPVCPACGGAGYLRLADAQPGDASFGKFGLCPTCTGEQRAQWRRQNCGLAGRELELRLEAWQPGDWQGQPAEVAAERRVQRRVALLAMSQAISDRCGLVTFWGDFGAGKSLALQIVVNELRLARLDSFYAPLALLLDHLRRLYEQKQETSHFWQRLLDIPVLAIDEVTRFNETPWALERLFVLIDTRYRCRASHLTLFATNADPQRVLPLEEKMGYLFSRMQEGALIELRGDLRGAGRDRSPG